MTVLDANGQEILDPESLEFQVRLWKSIAVEAFGGLLELTPIPGQRWKSPEAAHDYRIKVARYIYEHLPPGSCEARFNRRGFVFHDGPEPKPDAPSVPVDMPAGARDN